jgi:proteasome activator subunit 4
MACYNGALVQRGACQSPLSTNRFSWLLMRYPVPVRIRAKLVQLYYELCLLPGIEPRLVRSWADMLSRLLAGKSRRKLEPEDLQLPWKPLWRVLQKELWLKTKFQDPS